MDRLTTGRRHIRAGSVHVSELIGRRSGFIEDLGPVRLDGGIPGTPAIPGIPGSPLDAHHPGTTGDDGAASDGTKRDLLENLLDPQSHPGSHRRQPSPGAQLAKIAGLALASAVLCAALAVASTVTHDHHEELARPAMDISGEQALLPDRLNSAVPKGGMTGLPTLPGSPRHATGAIDNPGPAPRPAVPQTPGATGSGPTGPTGPTGSTDPFDPITKTELVQRFYQLARDAPERAFALLDATLLGTDLREFVHSWALVRDVQVLDLHEQSGDVLATVRMHLTDGSYLRVEQLLDVADTLPRRIVDAEVLSAQHD